MVECMLGRQTTSSDLLNEASEMRLEGSQSAAGWVSNEMLQSGLVQPTDKDILIPSTIISRKQFRIKFQRLFSRDLAGQTPKAVDSPQLAMDESAPKCAQHLSPLSTFARDPFSYILRLFSGAI
jgi:hypothetical protein